MIVEDRFDEVAQRLGCCTCEQCRADVIAYALNRLPCKYVVTTKGEVASIMGALRIQNGADILAALTQGAQVIKEFPRH